MKRKANDGIIDVSEPRAKKSKKDVCGRPCDTLNVVKGKSTVDRKNETVSLKRNTEKKKKENVIKSQVMATSNGENSSILSAAGSTSQEKRSKYTSSKGQILLNSPISKIFDSTVEKFDKQKSSVKERKCKTNKATRAFASPALETSSSKEMSSSSSAKAALEMSSSSKAAIETSSSSKAAVQTSSSSKTSKATENSNQTLKSNRKFTEPIRRPQKPQEFSSNWKKLIQSGTVTYQRKKNLSSTVNGKSNETAERSNATKEEEQKDEIWFDDVDQMLIEPSRGAQRKTDSAAVAGTNGATGENITHVNPLVKPFSQGGVTKAVAMDCEMVGVGYNGRESILARVSLVNQYGQCIYDKFCRPTEEVTDYRTHVSGIRPTDITSEKAIEFKQIQNEVCDIIKNKIVVGHALRNDFKVLYLDHPRRLIRDTARYKPFRKLFSGATPSLKKLTARVIGVSVQEGEHNSVQDAQAAMRLYTLHRQQWENEIKQRAINLGLRFDKHGKKC